MVKDSAAERADSWKTATLGIIAGKGVYPLELARGARRAGVKRLAAVGFAGETDRRLAGLVDEFQRLYVGELGRMIDWLRSAGTDAVVMAGQITPGNIFRVRMDARMRELLGRLKVRNADTIFGAVADELEKGGIKVLPASMFMEDCMPRPGPLTARSPGENEWADIELGLRIARATSSLNIGQTVVVKAGIILAVEAFEGTDAAIRRGRRLGGGGIVVVKAARRGHDMRFDIPVVGRETIRTLCGVGATALAVVAGKTIVLERDEVVRRAERCGLSIVAVEDEVGGNG